MRTWAESLPDEILVDLRGVTHLVLHGVGYISEDGHEDNAGMKEALKRIELLEKDTASRQLNAMIAEAKAERRITPGEAKTLAAKPDAFVADFLSMRPKAIVNTDETDLLHPNPQEHADLPAAQLADIDKMVAALPNLTDTQRAAVRTNMINGRRAVAAGAPNGAPGRF